MASTRFPGKPLVDLCGRPMIQWVVEAALRSGLDAPVIVATPDEEILSVCKALGLEAFRTRMDHPSGTDRIAEVASSIPADIYVNVQGDEPLIDSASIRACAQPLTSDPSVLMGSVWTVCGAEEAANPAVVKVVTDVEGNALYFSRFAIPFPRFPAHLGIKKHVGIYAYRGEAVEAFARWPQTPLELSEGLEQLRFLEHGVKIRMSMGRSSPVAVDTPEQADSVRILLSQREK